MGRDEECAVCIKHDYVSRHHAEVSFRDGQWWLHDLNSANGLFLEGRRIESAQVKDRLEVRLGVRGPFITLQVESAEPAALAHVADRYFGDPADSGAFSQRTIVIRRAFQEVQKKQRWRFRWAVGGLLLLALTMAGYAAYERHRYGRQQAKAEDLFYAMKAMELQLANVERLVLASANPAQLEAVRNFRQQRRGLEEDYDRYLESLQVYARNLPERDRLILRITRVFGECESALPSGYLSEVQKYIRYWQGSDRLERGIAAARQRGYSQRIADEFLRSGLPPQFFYLALQESNFDPYAVGPLTYKGYAKGMWQFIPETGVKYGLRLGPLQDLPRPDPGDERSDWERATPAAARYIKDLYATDAQASGLLVMACYNWGEHKVLPLVRVMPLNPRQRNFWRLLHDHRKQIPDETYGYVFSIVSAAVIGEDPRLFGFSFDNPLGHLDRR
jgi:membrane-bound lytic murein transglycosylase D